MAIRACIYMRILSHVAYVFLINFFSLNTSLTLYIAKRHQWKKSL